ncbi:MAG: hypothetical protein NHB32_07050 [Fischerella sp. CENA71]|nr:hypothetical protein [Fischerella sp. CENA71]
MEIPSAIALLFFASGHDLSYQVRLHVQIPVAKPVNKGNSSAENPVHLVGNESSPTVASSCS